MADSRCDEDPSWKGAVRIMAAAGAPLVTVPLMRALQIAVASISNGSCVTLALPPTRLTMH